MSPRISRSQMATYTYFHVCARGNNGQPIFIDDRDRIRYLALLERYRFRYRLGCYAYCLMTNHVHLLLESPSVSVLSKAIHGVHVAYVMHFNYRHQRKGHLFQDRFSSWVVEDEKHLLSAVEYIENNPVKAGLTKEKEDYVWSSARRDAPYVMLEQITG